MAPERLQSTRQLCQCTTGVLKELVSELSCDGTEEYLVRAVSVCTRMCVSVHVCRVLMCGC